MPALKHKFKQTIVFMKHTTIDMVMSLSVYIDWESWLEKYLNVIKVCNVYINIKKLLDTSVFW